MKRILALGIAGVVAAWLLALGLGASLADASTLAALSALAALAVGALGAILLATRWRRRPVAAQLGLVSGVTVAAVAAGTLVASADMFLSTAGTEDLLVVLASAGTAGAVVAQLLAGRIREAVRRLAALAERIGAEPAAGDQVRVSTHGVPAPRNDAKAPTANVPTKELATLAAQLEEASDRLRAAQASERALEASRRELMTWISHDLRTPLAGIRAMAEALEDGVADDAETVARYHRCLQVEVSRLAGMVDDLFQLSRISSGTLRMELEPVVLADLVSDALAVAGRVAEAKGVGLRASPIDPGVKVSLATAEFLRILHNLFENAARHTPSGGTVSLETVFGADEVALSVRDSCGGIPEADLVRVFEAGFRGDAARTLPGSPSPGNTSPGNTSAGSPSGRVPGAQAGLGLAIAQGLAEAHGGRIEVRNEGAGCCFCLHLPLGSLPLGVPAR